MEDPTSPKKNNGTSKVIDQLHSQIDELKSELETIRVAHDDFKKKSTILAQKNESFVDQLANAKHENDMVHALLKRKERRIVDLEDQYNDLSSENESLKLNYKNMKIRCEGLQESSASSTAEYERLKIAYDALLASQNEYKRHYTYEVQQLSQKFEAYREEQHVKFTELQKTLQSNDRDVDTLLDSLTNKKRAMETLYVNKNNTVLELLSKLAKVAKLHGQESKQTLQESIQVIKELTEKYPDIIEKIQEHEEIDINLDLILQESTEQLANSSFDDEATLVQSPDPQEKKDNGTFNNNNHSNSNSAISSSTHQQPNRRRKNKRNSMRIEGGNNSFPDFSQIQSPTSQPQLNVAKRMYSRSGNTSSKTRENSSSSSSTVSQGQNQNTPNSTQRRSNSGNNSSNNNKQKRRSMYGTNGYKSNNRQSFHEAQLERT